MAFIPDEAIDRLSELSKGARHLYVFLARCRNQRTGRCFPSVATTMESLAINRSSVFALRKELAAKGWAVFDGDEAINLLGFASPENQTVGVESKADSASPKNQTGQESEKLDCPENQTVFVDSVESAISPENQTDGDQSRNLDSKVQKVGLNSPEIQTAYKEEPAKEPAKITSKDLHVGAIETAASVWQSVFAEDPGIFRSERIEAANITDLEAWRETLMMWWTNQYSRRNLDGMIRTYRQKLQIKQQEVANGTNHATHRTDRPRETHNARAARETLALIRGAFDPASSDCGPDPENASPPGLALDRRR